jgi:hypothetical protein
MLPPLCAPPPPPPPPPPSVASPKQYLMMIRLHLRAIRRRWPSVFLFICTERNLGWCAANIRDEFTDDPELGHNIEFLREDYSGKKSKPTIGLVTDQGLKVNAYERVKLALDAGRISFDERLVLPYIRPAADVPSSMSVFRNQFIGFMLFEKLVNGRISQKLHGKSNGKKDDLIMALFMAIMAIFYVYGTRRYIHVLHH